MGTKENKDLVKRMKHLNGHIASDERLIEAFIRDWPPGKMDFHPFDGMMKYTFHPTAKTIHAAIKMPDGKYEFYRLIRLKPEQSSTLKAKIDSAIPTCLTCNGFGKLIHKTLTRTCPYCKSIGKAQAKKEERKNT